MSIKINKNGKEYPLGVIPQSLYDDVEDLKTPTFTEAQTRANIVSGETLPTILGKIKKWFTDLPSMFVSKSGDTISGILTVNATTSTQAIFNREHSDTSSKASGISIGNNIANGTSGSSYGEVVLFGKNSKYTAFSAPNSTEDRDIKLPDKSGILALVDDYGTFFYYPNNSLNARRFRFSNLSNNEAIQVLLFTRFGAYIIRGSCGTSGFSSVNAYPLYSDAPALTITNVTGYEFIVTIGTWCAIYGLYVHPHYPNSVLTITPESV